MSVSTALVTIVAILVFAGLRLMKLRAGDAAPRSGRAPTDVQPARDAEMAREIDDLRARIAVLERIVTEERRGKAIADEIEALRGS